MARPLPSLNALRAFEASARLGSVSQAAGELHVTTARSAAISARSKMHWAVRCSSVMGGAWP